MSQYIFGNNFLMLGCVPTFDDAALNSRGSAHFAVDLQKCRPLQVPERANMKMKMKVKMNMRRK